MREHFRQNTVMWEIFRMGLGNVLGAHRCYKSDSAQMGLLTSPLWSYRAILMTGKWFSSIS